MDKLLKLKKKKKSVSVLIDLLRTTTRRQG